MAEFNPSTGEGATPDFTRSSQGIRGGIVEADTSVADLFEGLGQGALLGVQAADQGVKAEIEQDVQAGFEQLDNEFGITSASKTEGRADADDVWGMEEATPKELRDAETQLSGLHAALQSGQLKESHYWARAQSIVRQLKGRYPGYQSEIDTMVSSITGVRPANALRRSLFQEWGEGAGDGEKKRQQLIAQISADESFENILPDFWERENSGNPYTITQINEARSKWNAEEAANRKRQSRLAVMKENKTLTQDEAANAFTDEVVTKSETLMQQSLTKMESGSGQSLMEIVIDAAVKGSQGQDIDAETARRLGQASEAARMRYEEVFEQMLDQQWAGSDDPDATYRKNMTDEAIEAARKQFMKPFERIERALTHGNFGILNQAALKHEAMKQDVTNTFVEENPQLDILFVLPELWGAAVFEQVMAHNPKLRTVVAELTMRIIDANKHLKERDGENDPNVTDDLEQVRNDPKISDSDASDITNAITQKHLNVVKNIGTDLELPPEILEAELSYLFNEKNFRGLQALSPEARREFFSRVAGPAVTKKMETFRKDGRTELWDMYQTYVAHEFEALFQEDVADLQERILQPEAYDIQWNPDKLAFEFKPNPDLSPVSRRNMEQAGLFTQLEEARRKINKAIKVVAPIIEANDRDPHVEIYRLMQDMGLDEQATAPEPTVFVAMMEALEFQMELGFEDMRKGDLPLIGIRGAERLGANVKDFTEPLRKSIWDTLRPFSTPFRSPEERRGDQGGKTEGSTQQTSSRSKPEVTDDGLFISSALAVNHNVNPRAPYGVSATQNAEPPRYLVVHHAVGETENLVKYGHTVDKKRGGSFGYHFYIAENGSVTQGAPLTARTNHVKPPSHKQRKDETDLSNSNSLGITLVNAHQGATVAQMAAAEQLALELSEQYGIPIDNILGHGELQNDRMSTEGKQVLDHIRSVGLENIPFEDRLILLEEANIEPVKTNHPLLKNVGKN